MINKLHFGPGLGWIKPDESWASVDADGKRADVPLNFNNFLDLPFDNCSIRCIYGSHIFEHINIFNIHKVFKECYRVLEHGGFLRIVIPDVRRSMEEYFKGNYNFDLFKRRAASLRNILGYNEVSLFELLKCDFISPSGQPEIFGQASLAHQNAWDYDALCLDLYRSGFSKENISKSKFRKSKCGYFSFEGVYASEADEFERSLYVEAIK